MVQIDILGIVVWEIYLSITNMILMRNEMSPETFKFGFIGWAMMIEVPRVILGFVVVQQLSTIINGKPT